MLSDEMRARLEVLNRQRLPWPATSVTQPAAEQAMPAAEQAMPAVEQAMPAAGQAQPAAWTGGQDPSNLSLGALVPGQVQYGTGGCHWLVRRRLADLWPDGAQRLAAACDRPGGGSPGADDPLHPELEAFAGGFPRQVLFLDLETCGFAGSAIFLAGLIYDDGAGLVLDQLLARDYTEERSVLAALGQSAAGRDVLVTFNGKSFDWPMIRDRRAYHRLTAAEAGMAAGQRAAGGPAPRVHCDLVHHARRRWRRRLPNCKLQTLEWFLCRRMRRGDIPGSRIGQEYHHFVRTGDARAMRAVLHHNALDLVTLVELALAVIR